MRTSEYPGDIPALTSLRYAAAAWVVFFHLSHYTAATALQDFPLVASGYLGVDFFFILSGFVLTHVYQPQLAAGRFDYWAFITKRLARVYPLHIVMLAVFIGIGAASRSSEFYLSPWVSGVSFAGVDNSVILRALVANVTLIHAWGATPNLMFNQPSWSISAEWFAYLMFPVLIMLRRRLPQAEAAKLIAVIAIFLVLAFGYWGLIHVELTRLTWNAGILRILPEFLLGMSLHQFGRRTSAGAIGSIVGFVASFAVVVVALAGTGLIFAPSSALSPTIAVLGLAGVVFFAADADRHGRLKLLDRPLPVYLGEISYSVYMIHLAVGIVVFDLLFPRWRPSDIPTAVVTVIAALTLATILSMATYRYIEVPARRWLNRTAMSLQPRTGDSA